MLCYVQKKMQLAVNQNMPQGSYASEIGTQDKNTTEIFLKLCSGRPQKTRQQMQIKVICLIL